MNDEHKTTNAVVGEPGQINMTIEVIRAGTGKKETFELIGTPIKEEKDDGCNT